MFPELIRRRLPVEVTVVNVFASWCILCRDEHPVLEGAEAADRRGLFGMNQKDAGENAASLSSRNRQSL